MAAPFGSGVVIAAIRAKLAVDTSLASLLADFATGFGSGPAIYEEDAVPGGATFPYLTIGAPTEVPFNTMGDLQAGGSECTVQVKVFSRKPSRAEMDAIAGVLFELLDGEPMTVSGYGSCDCQFDAAPGDFTEIVGGIRIRQLPLIFRVRVHES